MPVPLPSTADLIEHIGFIPCNQEHYEQEYVAMLSEEQLEQYRSDLPLTPPQPPRKMLAPPSTPIRRPEKATLASPEKLVRNLHHQFKDMPPLNLDDPDVCFDTNVWRRHQMYTVVDSLQAIKEGADDFLEN